MTIFVDASAQFDGDSLGAGSRVLAYVRVAPGATIGENCVLHDHAVLTGSVQLEDGVVVGPGAILGAPSADGAGPSGDVVVRRFASIGANVTVWPGVVIGRRAVVEPGAVVTENVPANAIVSGNPATIVAYVDGGEAASAREAVPPPSAAGSITETRVGGVTLHRLTHARDLRGSLTAVEFSGLPFTPRRIFTVYGVPSESVRGAHAHRTCSQFLICTQGSLRCLVDDGSAREEIRLASPDLGLHIPPMVWGTQWRYTRDAVLLVLASHPYDPDDYIRDYEDFVDALASSSR